MPALSRRTALAGLAAAALPLRPGRARAQALDKFVLQTGWRAQAEHGGLYQALATGLYRAAGIDMDIRMGGPQVDGNALLFGGRVDMATGTGFSGLVYARENVPFIVVAATFQKDTRVLLSHPGVGNDTLPALKGKPILVAAVGRVTYWPWLRSRFGFTDEQIRPYTFNIAPFLTNPQVSMQGLATSEPLDAQRAGVKPVLHYLADYGWTDYQQTFTTSRKLAEERPDLVQRVIEATAKGWQSYLHGDPEPGNRLIKQANPDMDDEKIAFSRTTMRDAGLIESGDAATLGVGAITRARMASLYEAMVESGVMPAGLDYERGYSFRFFKA